MGDEIVHAQRLSSGSSSDVEDGSSDSEEDAMAELVRSMEIMLARSAPARARSTTPAATLLCGSSDDAAAAGVAPSHSDPARDWREEWRCSSRLSPQTDTEEDCKRSCMPVAEAQRSRVVGIPGLLDAGEIEQIQQLAGLCADADPFWDT
jgi:hypothetical protein